MTLLDYLPIDESLGVFVGISGFDWLTEGRAEPLKALAAALAIGLVISLARRLNKDQRPRRND